MSDFRVINHFVCRLNVVALTALIADKVYFIVSADTASVISPYLLGNNAYIDIESPDKKFVVDYILQKMREFYLPEIMLMIWSSATPCSLSHPAYRVERRNDLPQRRIPVTILIIPLWRRAISCLS